MLSESLTSTDAAAVLSTSGRTNTGFTHDRARLQKAILSLRAAPVYVGSRVECPSIDHYEAFMIQNQHDPETLEAIADQGCSPDKKMDEGMARVAAAWEMAAGERATHISLDVIQQIARQMGALPGQRTLILISPGFIALTPEAMKDQAIVADTAAQANVTVSTLDARGLDPRTMPIEKAREATAEVNVRRDSSIAYGKVMSDLAASTGGTYIHDSNDLQGGLQRLAQPPECVYLLEFSPKNVKQDHTFHALRVKVDPKGLIIRARPGYFADSPGNDNQNAHPR